MIPARWAVPIWLVAMAWSTHAARFVLRPHDIEASQSALRVHGVGHTDGEVQAVRSMAGVSVLRTSAGADVAVLPLFWPAEQRRLFSLHCRELARAPAASV